MQARNVETGSCRFCGRVVVLHPKSEKISHETPICDAFREQLAEITARHGVSMHEGETYWALLLEKPKGEQPS